MLSWDGGLVALRNAAVTAVALVVTLLVALQIRSVEHLGDGLVVLAVAVASILAQSSAAHDLRTRAATLVVVPLVTALALPVGVRLVSDPVPADVVFCCVMGLAIFVRRWGVVAAGVGSAVALPFVAVLITPPATLGSDHRTAWAALMTVVAALVVHACQLAGQATGLTRRPRRPPPTVSLLRPSPSTRQALQMAASLGVAFAVAHQLFPTRTTFLVLTAYLVNSGNRGRGDVVHKAALRVVGASAGTVVAFGLAGAFAPGDRSAVVLMMAIIVVVSWLRAWSYSIWVVGLTCVVALLQDFFGGSSRSLLETRLESIAIGSLVGVAAAWFVLPVRSTDVARRRCADALAALQALLDAARKDPAAVREAEVAFLGRLSLVAQVARPVQLHGRLRGALGRDAVGHPSTVVTAVLACDRPARVLAAATPDALADPVTVRLLGRTVLAVGDARRALGGLDVERRDRPPLSGDGPPLRAALARVDEAMAAVSGRA